MPRVNTPKLPKFIQTKIYKTGQTRGADNDVIFQNRVGRNSRVLIPYSNYEQSIEALDAEFEKGFTVLIPPELYFENIIEFTNSLREQGLVIGENALLFYETRQQWEAHNPIDNGLSAAQTRETPLGGEFVSRVASTTSENRNRENHGYTTSGMKGAGIRVYEYASKNTIDLTRIQLEYLFWSCYDSIEECVNYGMSREDALLRKAYNRTLADEDGLTEIQRLVNNRMINNAEYTVCPLCLEQLSSKGFFEKVAQAEGRSVHDLTVTQINLFHIKEIRFGEYNHKEYNLSWGHHHCNVVVKDSGIEQTLEWMRGVVSRNDVLE